MRIERDCLGEMEIPNDRYYGIQTIRNMKVSGAAGFPVVAYPDMHKALCQIKKACAKANAEIGAMKPEIAQAISAACAKVIAGGVRRPSLWHRRRRQAFRLRKQFCQASAQSPGALRKESYR